MFTENLDRYLADFGEDVTLAGQPGRAIYNAPYAAPLGVVASAAPTLRVTDATLAASFTTVGSACVVRGASYRVAGIEPDGTGMSVLVMERQ